MYCPQCGKEYSEKVNFCCHCGSAIPQGGTPAKRQKKLQRSRGNKKIAGVCAGFADYLDLDVTLVRLIWLMLAFVGGWGLIAYLVAWIIMPEEPEVAPVPQRRTAAPSAAPQPAPNH